MALPFSWLPLLVDAMLYSSAIALLSSGLTLTYMTTKVPNFAHGTVSMIGLYFAFTSVRIWKVNPYYMIPLAFLLAGLGGLGLYLLVLKPLIARRASLVSLMIATIGFDLFVFSLINIYADYLTEIYGVVTRFFSLENADFKVNIFGGVPGLFFVATSSVIALSLLLHFALVRTKFGVAMRATVENPALAGVVGVNVNRIYSVSWFVSGGIAGVSGLFAGLFLAGSPDLGNRLIPTIFAASIVGGLGNIYGALLGGFIVGLAELLGTFLLASWFGSYVLSYQTLVPLSFIVVTLLLAPRGITGVDWRAKLYRLHKHTPASGQAIM